MNRAERRRQQKSQVKKEAVYSVKRGNLDYAKRAAADMAIDTAFKLMLGIPVMVLHDKYGFGKKRLPEFMDHVMELYDSFNRGYLTLDDIVECLEKETGIKLIEKGGA